MNAPFTPIQQRAHCKWFGILSAIGIDRKHLTKRNGPCPFCGGKDRFRWTDFQGSGAYFCSQCGKGSGVDLVMRWLKCDFKTAAARIDVELGVDHPQPKVDDRTDDAKRKAMADLWAAGIPVTQDTPAGRYLVSRGIVLDVFPAALRSIDFCQYDRNLKVPAMLAKVTAPDGHSANVHRTYLLGNGQKDRKMMTGPVPPGSAIRLGPVAPVKTAAIQRAKAGDSEGAAKLLSDYSPQMGDRYLQQAQAAIEPILRDNGASAWVQKNSMTDLHSGWLSGHAASGSVPLVDVVAHLESGGSPNAASNVPGSTSTGMYGQTDAARKDFPSAEAQLDDAARRSQAALGRPPQPWETYVTYQQGVGGGPELLKADRNAKAIDVLGQVKQYRDHPDQLAGALTNNGFSKDATVGQVLDTIRENYSKAEGQVAQAATSVNTVTGQAPKPSIAIPTSTIEQREAITTNAQILYAKAEAEYGPSSGHPDPVMLNSINSHISQDQARRMQMVQANELDQRSARQQAQDILNKNPVATYDDVKGFQDGMGPDNWKSIADQLEHRASMARNQNTDANQSEFYRLRMMASKEPDKFQSLPLGTWLKPQDGHPALTDQQFHELTELQAGLINKDGVAARKLDFTNKAMANMDVQSVLWKAGINEKRNAQAYHQFGGAFGTAIDGFRATHDNKDPTSKDLVQIANQLTQKVAFGGLWNSDGGMLFKAADGKHLQPADYDPKTGEIAAKSGQVIYSVPPDFKAQAAAALKAKGLPATDGALNALYHSYLTKNGLVQ